MEQQLPIVLDERVSQIVTAGDGSRTIACERTSLAGSVSQRACVFCGSRVVLYPIADALHLVHGPIGCATYTWDIRGALSSGPQLHRSSFCTDLRERDIIHGGEAKLTRALDQLIDRFAPRAAFVYSTCVAGVIGDDIEAVCKKMSLLKGIPVIPVGSEGFRGTKKDGYRAACDALLRIIGTDGAAAKIPLSINIIGDFNVAGETWLVRRYFAEMGITVVATLTGDGRIDDIRRANTAALNIVQCSGSMTPLAKAMQERYGIPFKRISFFGIDDTADALYAVADHFADPAIVERTKVLVRTGAKTALAALAPMAQALRGMHAGLYVGGAFKAISLVKALRRLGITTALAGTQTGNKDDYERLRSVCDPDTMIVDDSNPAELSRWILERDIDLFIGGVKERPMAYKLGVAFCDHNHERKIGLAGFEGMVNFGREVYSSLCSPVWRLVRNNRHRGRGVA
jgi:nitrogenase molybdenum-cofactor synthesis protein NifE